MEGIENMEESMQIMTSIPTQGSGKTGKMALEAGDEVNVIRTSVLIQGGDVAVTTNERNEVQVWRRGEQEALAEEDQLAGVGALGGDDDNGKGFQIDLS